MEHFSLNDNKRKLKPSYFFHQEGRKVLLSAMAKTLVPLSFSEYCSLATVGMAINKSMAPLYPAERGGGGVRRKKRGKIQEK